MSSSAWRTALCASVLVLAPAAHAQYDPGASLMLGQGMGFNALSQSTMTNAFNASRPEGESSDRSSSRRAEGPVLRNQADVDRYMNERMQYHTRALTPEYKRRAARDGQASADRWIRARAEELGKMEGEKARQLVRRD